MASFWVKLYIAYVNTCSSENSVLYKELAFKYHITKQLKSYVGKYYWYVCAVGPV